MTQLDWGVVFGYFVFILIAAMAFKKFATSSSSFIQGGGSMVWWMAGATAFMTQFSAWTFTGAAAKAYEDGLSVMFVFWGNALGFFVSAAFFAGRYRRLRVETAMEVIKLRFGKVSEQVYTWLSFPITLIACAIWLNGLGAFVSATFQFDLSVTIIGISTVVTVIALSGGAWTVSATNVVQLILLVAITVVVGMTATDKLIDAHGGFAALGDHMTRNAVMGEGITYWQVFAFWACAMLVQQTMSTNNALSSYRFLVTVNEREAEKAARLAGMLFLIAPLLWFAPAWFVSAQAVDLQANYPSLGAQANNAAYLYYIDKYMPQGLLGMVLVAMIAATIAPMTAALNRNAGIIVKNVYLSVIRPAAQDAQQLAVGKWSTLMSGVVACATAMLLANVKAYSLFDIMMMFSAFVQMPLSIPSLLALVCLRTPGWSGWATILVGMLVSAFMMLVFDVNHLQPLFGDTPFTIREQKDLTIVSTLLVHLLITGGFFISTRLFYREPDHAEASVLPDTLMARLNRPMTKSEQAMVDHRQGQYLGRIGLSLGVIVAGVAFIQPVVSARLIYLGIGGLIMLCGWGLSAKNRPKAVLH